ncbi:MAG TPA: heme ABC exporter ATP-binding protein CcmA [Actinomycetota bacterium]|nr:heme ABC exporter ATP-binding protein CcmA [Actinomycetota bacterium]
MISTREVRVVFGGTVALSAIDLELGSGIVGLFGPNGSGKTTLLRVLTGLLPPTSGEVLYDGAPLDLRDEAQRRMLGYAGHSSGLYDTFTVRENLELFARLYGAVGRVPHVIEALALTEVAGTRVGHLSAGWVRRAAVARAMVHDPQMLLLDEPYANLDDDASDIVSNAIRAWHSPGRTAVIATHGAKRVRAYADAGVVLRRGEVASARSSFATPEPV